MAPHLRGIGTHSSPPVLFDGNDHVIAEHKKSDSDIDYYPLPFIKLLDLGDDFELIQSVEYASSVDVTKSTHNLAKDAQGNIYSVGYYFYNNPNTNAMDQAGFLLKMNANLDSLWLRKYNYFEYTSATERLRDINVAPNGDIVLLGISEESLLSNESQYPGLDHVWTLKVDEQGCLEPGCHLIDGLTDIIVGLENTMTIYPNPVIDFTTVQFQLPSTGTFGRVSEDVSKNRLVLINAIGQQVLSIPFEKFYPYSSFNFQIDLSSHGSGFYTLHWMNGSTWVDSVKLIKQ